MVYIWQCLLFFLEIWQLCGLLHQTTFAGFTTLSFVAKWPYLAPKRTLFTNRGLSFQFCDIKNLMKISNKLENSIKFTVDKQKSYKKNLFMKIIYICIHSNDQKSQIHFMPATWWFFQFF